MKRNLQLLSMLMLTGAMAFAQGVSKKGSDVTHLHKVAQINQLDATPTNAAMGGGPCTESADTWNDLGSAPCADSLGNCMIADAGFTTIGVYGSETYTLADVDSGYDFVFDMCSGGAGAGSWIPEITIVAPDGTTIEAHNAASSTSGQTHADQCTLAWTSTQSGTYSIVINEMGTSMGDAPNQANCTTSYAVDNGNPTVECGPNAMHCAPAGPCSTGVLCNSGFPKDFCTCYPFTLASDGSEESDGGFGFALIPGANAGGGSGGPVTISGYDAFPITLDDGLDGILAAQNPPLPALTGSWVFGLLAYDASGGVCATSADTVVVTFLPASDPACPQGIEDEINLGLEVYPNPSNGTFVVEMDGDNAMTTIKVMDMTGREVYSENTVVGMNYRAVLDLNVVPGTYLMSVITNSVAVTRKLQVK